MNLPIFFSPLNEDPAEEIADPGSLAFHIDYFREEFPAWREAQVAVFGVPEERGTLTNPGVSAGPDMIRKRLYRLKKGSDGLNIADLGNLCTGVDLEETYNRIREVCEFLIDQNIVPVIIGGSHDLDFGQFLSYENQDKLISIVNVDAGLDMEGSEDNGSDQNHIHRMLVHDPNYIFTYIHLAHQTFLVQPESLEVLEKLYFDTRRLGEIRENIKETEPLIRHADMMSFDISAIKKADAPGNKKVQPFGLTGEEACQLAWYAGHNDNLSSIGFYEYNPEADHEGQTAAVVATMIWYFLEGFKRRSPSPDFSGKNYYKYVVSLDEDPHELVFYKARGDDKWWLEVPYPAGRERFARNAIVPCSYQDYQTANEGHIPDIWLNTHAKLV